MISQSTQVTPAALRIIDELRASRIAALIDALREARLEREAAFAAWLAEIDATGRIDGPACVRHGEAAERVVELLRQANAALSEHEILGALNPGVEPRDIPF